MVRPAYIIGSFSTTLATMGEDKAKFETKMRSTAELLKFLEVRLWSAGALADVVPFVAIGMDAVRREERRGTWTVLRHDGPDHLGL